MIIKIHNYGKIPAKKNRMRVVGKRMIKDEKTRTFEAMLKTRATQIMMAIGSPIIDGPVKLHLDVTFGDRRRRDLQNLFGSVCDSLNGVVYEDDCQITKLSACKRYQKGIWEYTITITTLKYQLEEITNGK
jgi:Holliday junction resolvase RusA-like endonuclease